MSTLVRSPTGQRRLGFGLVGVSVVLALIAFNATSDPKPAKRTQTLGAQDRAVRDATERKDHAHRRERGQFSGEIAVALADLRGRRLVAGRHALDRIRDARSHEPQPVIAVPRFGCGRPAELVQGPVQQQTRVIARERAAGGIGPMKAGRQAHDQEPRRVVTERRDRRAVIPGMLATAHVEVRGEP